MHWPDAVLPTASRALTVRLLHSNLRWFSLLEKHKQQMQVWLKPIRKDHEDSDLSKRLMETEEHSAGGRANLQG